VWDTAFARLGVGICWDQWFPEAARCMALLGAEVLLYPTAIGSDPPAPATDSSEAWHIVQRGHAVANAMPLVASNRVGLETAPASGTVAGAASGSPGAAASAPGAADVAVRFYGSSFIASETGELLAEASRDREEVLIATVDLDALRCHRESWAFFRDRRPGLYGPLLALDGED
jgi:N-carbamoylputrescine amidase